MSLPCVRLWPWLAAWLMVMTAMVVSLILVRQRVVEQLSSPEKMAQWRAWRAQNERLEHLPGTVQRRTVKADEPPALVLLRDYFGAIVATSVLMGSFLFAFLAFMARGIWRQRGPRQAAHADPHPGEDRV